MKDLVQLTLDAHGGLERWSMFDKVTVHMKIAGELWEVKCQDSVACDNHFEIELRKQRGRYIDFENKPGQATYFSPNRVAIVNKGCLVEELLNPRDSFHGHVLETPWSKLQLIYFVTYSVWEYLIIPFLLSLPGFQSQEVKPWHERGETWRKLKVIFPYTYAYHTQQQEFYFDKNGLLKRLDYNLDISGGISVAQYVYDYKDFQGIELPSKGLVYLRDDKGYCIQEPLLLQISLLDAKFG